MAYPTGYIPSYTQVPGGSGLQPYSYNSAYGGIPNLPNYLTDTTSTAGTDVQGQMIQNLPGYQGMSAADSANIQANLAGQINPDVLALMQQQGAERGIATGSPGSPNSNAAYLRALGLTSQGLQQLGNQQLTAAMQRTPIQQTNTTTQQTDLAALKAMYAAAPVPASAAAANQNALSRGLNSGNQAGGGQNYWQQQADAMNKILKDYYAGMNSAPMGAGYTPNPWAAGTGPGTGNMGKTGMGTDSWWDQGYYDPEGLLSGGDYYGTGNYGEQWTGTGAPPAGYMWASGPAAGPNAADNTTALANAMRAAGVGGEQDTSGFAIDPSSYYDYYGGDY